MNEEQVNLQAIEQFVSTHPQKDDIERFARSFRETIAEYGESARIALALVGAELAAAP